ncbi:MAG TPA: hypothetical protein VIZ58_13020, partial [Thermoanaerobaculia bacterium]
MSASSSTAANRLRRLLSAIDDLDLRARRAAEMLRELPVEDAVSALDAVLRGAQKRLDPDAVALQGVLRGLHAHVGPELSEQLRRAAEDAEAHAVRALFTESEARKSFDVDREAWVDREMRARSLGERKALARGRDRDLLARLAQDHDPAVVRNLLENPR